MSEEEQPKKKGTLKTACISALIASVILTGVTMAGAYYIYSQVIKPTLKEAGIDINIKDIPSVLQKYNELLTMVKEYERLKAQYVNEQNWEKLDELNRSYDQHKDDIESLRLILETYNIKFE